MKNLILITVISMFILLSAGCQMGGVSPDNVSVDNPITVEQLVNAVSADEAAWKGKKVAVSAYASASSSSDKGYKISLKNKENPDSKTYAGCQGEGEIPDKKEIFDKKINWVFEGTVEQMIGKDNVILIDCKPIKK